MGAESRISYIHGHILGANIRLLVRQAQNNHTGPIKVVSIYVLIQHIWAVGIIKPYIYVRGIRKAC